MYINSLIYQLMHASYIIMRIWSKSLQNPPILPAACQRTHETVTKACWPLAPFLRLILFCCLINKNTFTHEINPHKHTHKYISQRT